MPLLRGLLRAAISVGFFAAIYLANALRDWIEPNEFKSTIWDLPLNFLAMFFVLLAFVAPWMILPGPNRMIDEVKRLPRWLRWFYRDNDDYEYW